METPKRRYFYPIADDFINRFPDQLKDSQTRLDTDVQKALDDAAAAVSNANGRAPAKHAHTVADVTGLADQLKAAGSQTLTLDGQKLKLSGGAGGSASEVTLPATSGGSGGLAPLVDIPRNTATTTAATHLKATKDSATGLAFITGKVVCLGTVKSGDLVATLPDGYMPPTSFNLPIFVAVFPQGAQDMTKADYLSFNVNNGELRIYLNSPAADAPRSSFNFVFSINYIPK